MTMIKGGLISVVLLAGALALVGCNNASNSSAGTADAGGNTATEGGAKLSGTIVVDGSSTVYVVTEKVADGFMTKNPDVSIEIGISGTGGGFKKFGAGETDISNASRPIAADEIEGAKKNNVEFFEVPVAYDGLTVVVNKENTWVDSLTVEELKKIWEPTSKVKTWADVRAGWPATPIKLYGPGTDSGTFDFFTKVIMGEEGAARPDFTPSEDDNVLVTGVAGDKGALGYFGYAYYLENQDKLRAVPIDAGNGPVAPTADTILSQEYKPLSRPEFIYVKSTAMERPEVKAFVEFYLSPDGQKLIQESGYVPFKPEVYTAILARVNEGTKGSVFSGNIGKPVHEILNIPSTTTAPQ